MGHSAIYRLLLLAALVAFGGCANVKGIVPSDMNITMTNVVVTQANGVEEGNRFSHELREELRKEFSRAPTGPKRTKLVLEVNGLTYVEAADPKSANRMTSYGTLIDVVTGDRMGEFPLTITANDVGADAQTSYGRATINAELMTKTAAATLDRVYGPARAKKLLEISPSHLPEPYLIRVASPVRLTPKSPDVGTLPKNIVLDVPKEALPEDEKPTVIAAPDLPVQ